VHVIVEAIAATVGTERAEMLKPDTSKSCATSTLSMRDARRSSSRRAAVVDMPLVDMMAMSNRSAILAGTSSALNNSFSINRTAEYLFSGPVVGDREPASSARGVWDIGRSPRYCRTSTVPSGTFRSVCASMRTSRVSARQ
jgi:hypothetical protein